MSQQQSYKVVIVGNTRVGKTCIVDKLVSGCLADDVAPTIGASFMTYLVKKPKGPGVRLHIWDTAGQEQFMSITSTYYRNAAYAVLVFDMTDRSSFDNLDRWLSDLHDHAPPTTKIVLVGNKKDLEIDRKVTVDEAEKFKSDHDLVMYREVSALTGYGIKELFDDLTNIDANGNIVVEKGTLEKSTKKSDCC